MITLIADSGSTKTDWAVSKEDSTMFIVQTQGINPFLQERQTINHILQEDFYPQLRQHGVDNLALVASIYFYGAGCRPEKMPFMREILADNFPSAGQISVGSDLLAAAYALCGNNEGLVCILGTGSNSCYYDGKKIVANISPLGFILGDEGSGAYLGKTLLSRLLKGELPDALIHDFYNEYHYTPDQIIEKVYRNPMPNRFMAGFTRFISAHRHEKEMQCLLVDGFRSFFERNICLYGRPDLPVQAIGSIAFYFEKELTEAAFSEGYCIEKIMKSPLQGIIEYLLCCPKRDS